MWFIGVEAEQETSAPPPKKNPGSAPDRDIAADDAVTRNNKYTLNFPLLGCNVLTHAKEKVIHVVVNVVTVSC